MAAALILSPRGAGAQPVPESTPAPAADPPSTVEDAASTEAPAPLPAAQPTQSEPAGTTPPAEDDKAAGSAQGDQAPVTVTYKGGLVLATPDDRFELKLAFRNQFRFESRRSFDDETPTRHNQFENTFYIPRTRFVAEGHAFGKDNRFKAELAYGDRGNFAYLRDMYLEKRIPGTSVFFRAGQWKRPFDRAEIVSDFGSTFNERSIHNDLTGGGRSQGIALHNQYEKSPAGLEWAVGVFNTFSGGGDRPVFDTDCVETMPGVIDCNTSRPTTTPTDFGPTIVARIGWNSPRMKGYTEGDFEGGPLRYAVGASYKIDLANFSAGMEESWLENTSHGLEVDTMIKAYGFTLQAGVAMMILSGSDPELGLFVQPSMFVVPEKVEIGGRFAVNTLTQPGSTPGTTVERHELEARAAFNYYWQGHAWKVASDLGFTTLTGGEPSDDGPDLQLRIMMQMSI